MSPATSAAATSSITPGTSSSATTSWIFGAARAALSRSALGALARAPDGPARAAPGRAARRGGRCAAARRRAPRRPPPGSARRSACERRRRAARRARSPPPCAAARAASRPAAMAADLAQRADRRQAGVDGDAQQVEHVGELARDELLARAGEAAQPHVGREERRRPGRRRAGPAPARGGTDAASHSAGHERRRRPRRPWRAIRSVGSMPSGRPAASSSATARSRRGRRADAARRARRAAHEPAPARAPVAGAGARRVEPVDRPDHGARDGAARPARRASGHRPTRAEIRADRDEAAATAGRAPPTTSATAAGWRSTRASARPGLASCASVADAGRQQRRRPAR